MKLKHWAGVALVAAVVVVGYDKFGKGKIKL